MTQVVDEFSIREVCLTFSDVAWNRDRGTTDLVSQAVDFSLRETFCQLIDTLNQIHRLLPCDKVSIVLSPWLFVFCSNFAVRTTRYAGVTTRDSGLATRNSPAMPYVHHVPILHDVVLALQAQLALRAGVGFRTGFE